MAKSELKSNEFYFLKHKKGTGKTTIGYRDSELFGWEIVGSSKEFTDEEIEKRFDIIDTVKLPK